MKIKYLLSVFLVFSALVGGLFANNAPAMANDGFDACDGVVGVAKNSPICEGRNQDGEEELQERIAGKELSGEYSHEKRTQVSHLSIEQANEFIIKHLKPLGEYQYIHQHQEREGADAK